MPQVMQSKIQKGSTHTLPTLYIQRRTQSPTSHQSNPCTSKIWSLQKKLNMMVASSIQTSKAITTLTVEAIPSTKDKDLYVTLLKKSIRLSQSTLRGRSWRWRMNDSPDATKNNNNNRQTYTLKTC